MKRTDTSIEPLNIYSGSFFGLWLLAMLASVGWRVSDGPSYKAQIEEWHQNRVKSSVFNQAINPPCAFTTFATCPLPPRQNKLALAITAGEKRYGDH